MFKKGISLLAAMLVFMSFATTTFAAVPITPSELNEDNTWKGSYWKDNFDYAADIDLETGGYPSSSKGATSDVFSNSGNTTGPSMIDADGGKSGGALVLTANSTTGNKLTWDTSKLDSMAANQTAVFSYDIKFSGLSNLTAEEGAIMRLNGGTYGSRNLISVTADGAFGKFDPGYYTYRENVSITENAWYSVVTTVTKLANGDIFAEFREVSIYDANGNFVMGSSRLKNGTENDAWVDGQLEFSLTLLKTNADTTATVTVDNASLSYYDSTKYAPGLKNTPAIANQIVGIADQKVNVTFDQPISGTPTATLKKVSDGSTVATCSAAAATIVHANNVMNSVSPYAWTVTVPASALAEGTNYELVFDGFKNLGGAASTASVLFATKDKTAQDMTMTADFTNLGAVKSYGAGVYYENYPLLSFIRNGDDPPTNASVVDGVFQTSGTSETGWLTVKTSPVDNNHPNAPALYFSDFSKAYVLTYRMRVDAPATGDFVADFMAGVAPQGLPDAEGKETTPADRATGDNFVAEFWSGETEEDSHTVRQSSDLKTGEKAATVGTWQPNTWYKVIWSVANGVQTYRLYDETTDELVFERTRAISGIDTENPTQYWLFSLVQQEKVNPWNNNGNPIPADTVCTAGFSLDDVTLWTLDNTQDWSKPRYVANSVADETVTLTFDQPLLAEGSDYTVTNNATGKVEQGVTVSVTQLGDCSQKLSFTGLDYNTTYTLNYKDIKNVAGQDLANKNDAECVPAITLTTGAYDAGDGYVIVGNPTFTTLTQSSTIGFNVYCPIEKTGAIFVALYDTTGALLGVEKYDLVAAASGKVGASVTLGKDYSTATSMKIFAWTTDLKPELLPVVRTLA